MPVIPIDDEGHHLYYEDSGPPTDSVYTTLIIVHGTAFHAQIFRRMLPFAHKYQLRIVLVNRRDYPGSSPYTEEDLNKIRKDDIDGHVDFARARASEFARFIECFVENERVTKASSDWKLGGVVLLAWSSGNSYTLPLLAYADSILERTRDTIEPYLRSHVIFDAPRWILGPPILTHGFGALTDESLSQKERARRFNDWVSAYYSHKSLTSRNISDLQLTPIAGPLKSTIEKMSAEDEQETTYYPALPRSEIGARTGNPSIYAERVRRALFDDDLAKYFPRCTVDIIWGENSTWAVVDAMWKFQIAREKADEEGVTGRPMKIIMMPGVNHFPHWEEPESTVKFFAGVINAC